MPWRTAGRRRWVIGASWCVAVFALAFVAYGLLGDWGNTTTDDVGETGARGQGLILSGSLVFFSGLGLILCGCVLATMTARDWLSRRRSV